MKDLRYVSWMLAAALGLVSCSDSFLDKDPDERVTLTDETQITKFLVSGYSDANQAWICEISSDNIVDNNSPHLPADFTAPQVYTHSNLAPSSRMDEELFRFEQVRSSTSEDSPSDVWQSHYNAIATANFALENIDAIAAKTGMTPRLRAARAEALLIRAYYHFQLVNVFSQAYKDAEQSKKDIGVPYITKSGDKVSENYDRGNVYDVYQNIEADLQEGLKDVVDTYYDRPKWHFNVNAARAFAARFYLFKRDYDKVIEYADMVLSTDSATTANMLMSYEDFAGCTSSTDYANVWQNPARNNNLMLVATNSIMWRYSIGQRFSQTSMALREILYHLGPNWRWYVIPTAYASGMTFWDGNEDHGYCSAKIAETFEYTDKVAGIGYPHIVRREFTATELLLERAEAKLLSKTHQDIDGAVRDLLTYDASRWTFSEDDKRTFFANGALVYLTREMLESYYSDPSNYNCFADWDFTKDLTSELEIPANIVPYMNCVNEFRRFELNFEGMRFLDMKRWGMPIRHEYGPYLEEYVLDAQDPRRAIEIPLDAASAGLKSSREAIATGGEGALTVNNNRRVQK